MRPVESAAEHAYSLVPSPENAAAASRTLKQAIDRWRMDAELCLSLDCTPCEHKQDPKVLGANFVLVHKIRSEQRDHGDPFHRHLEADSPLVELNPRCDQESTAFAILAFECLHAAVGRPRVDTEPCALIEVEDGGAQIYLRDDTPEIVTLFETLLTAGAVREFEH